MKHILLIVLLFAVSSCSSYINALYRDLDQGQKKTSYRRHSPRSAHDKFDQFRNAQQHSLPKRSRDTISTSQKSRYLPKTKRRYVPESQVKRRFKADDLNDNQNVESLWAGENKSDYLFTLNDKKKPGDIILVNVFTKLKNEITLELKKSFKERRRPAPKKPPEAGGAQVAPVAGAEGATPAAEEEAAQGADKIHDRISTVIIEEISDDHVLLRGQKFLLYKNKKRLIELQALVSRKDITDDDAINSPKILESNISILR